MVLRSMPVSRWISLALTTLEQREYGRLQMRLEDLHSSCPSLLRRSDDNVLPLLISDAQALRRRLRRYLTARRWRNLKWPQVGEILRGRRGGRFRRMCCTA